MRGPQRLHRDEIIQMRKEVEQIADVFRDKIGNARVAVKRCGDDVAEAGKHHDRIDVIVGQRAAAVAVREQKQRVARRCVGELRGSLPRCICGSALPVGST